MRPDEQDPDDLPPSEMARDRRRDRHARAAERAGMRTGLAKQFKQVLDTQAKRAREAIAGEDDRDVEDAAPGHDRRDRRDRREDGPVPPARHVTPDPGHHGHRQDRGS